MPAKGSVPWYRQRREGSPTDAPAPPMKPIKDLVEEAMERLKRLADERDKSAKT